MDCEMKLDAKSAEIRRLFRNSVLDLWPSDANMRDVVAEIIRHSGASANDIYHTLLTIPSIGKISAAMRIRVWVGHNYPKVSEAMFDNDRRAAITLFVSKNRQSTSTVRPEKVSAKRFDEQLKQIRTLNSEKGDRYAKTDWKICK